jgi:hypothetical protein
MYVYEIRRKSRYADYPTLFQLVQDMDIRISYKVRTFLIS